jgi:hypothetical protein
MGKHLLAKAHVAKSNQLTESEVTELASSMVDETALAILKRQGGGGITFVSSRTKLILVIPLNLYWSKGQTKHSKRSAKDIQTFKFHQDKLNPYLMLGFVSAHTSRNAVSNLLLCQSYKPWQSDPVLPSPTTLRNISRREYALTVGAITKQLPSWHRVSLALNRWTSANKLTIMSVIAYYMDRNWALGKVQLAFEDIDHLFDFSSES